MRKTFVRTHRARDFRARIRRRRHRRHSDQSRTRRPATARCGARSRPASIGSIPRRSTAMGRRRRRSAGTWNRCRRGPMFPPRCGSKPATSATFRARSSAAWSKVSSGCGPIGSRCCSCTITSAQRSASGSRLSPGAGARARRRRRHLRPAQGAGADPRQRHDRRRRYHGLPRGDQRAAASTPPRSITTPSIRAPPGGACRRAGAAGRTSAGILAACFHQNMGVLNIRVWAGGVLASPARPDGLFMMTSDTDLGNEMQCAAAVRARSATAHGTPAQAALRFVLGNRDLASPGDRIDQARAAQRGARGGGARAAADRGRLQARGALGQRICRGLTGFAACIIVHEL